MTDGAAAVVAHIDASPDEFRDALSDIRARILRYLTERDIPFVERMSYGMPGVQLLPEKKMIAGYAAHKTMCGLYPHSGGVVAQISDQIGQRSHTKSALHFTPSDPIPDRLLTAMLDARIAEIRN